jgi:hypothetical protein
MSEKIKSIKVNQLDLVENYLSWLRQNIKSEDIENGYHFTLPFLDNHNDHIEIYAIKTSSSEITLTDGGYIINDLEISGVSFDCPARKNILEQTLLNYGVKLEESDKSIYIKTDLQNLPKRKHSLVQCILAISNLYVLARANKISKIALESERPNLKIQVSDESKNNIKQKYLTLKNEGNTDAIYVTIFAKKYGQKMELLESELNLSTNIEHRVNYFEGVYSSSIIIIYKNPLNNKIYLLGYDIDSGSNSLSNLKSEDNGINYQKFLHLYKIKDKISFQQVVKNASEL